MSILNSLHVVDQPVDNTLAIAHKFIPVLDKRLALLLAKKLYLVFFYLSVSV